MDGWIECSETHQSCVVVTALIQHHLRVFLHLSVNCSGVTLQPAAGAEMPPRTVYTLGCIQLPHVWPPVTVTLRVLGGVLFQYVKAKLRYNSCSGKEMHVCGAQSSESS